jgi:hypothetical protein
MKRTFTILKKGGAAAAGAAPTWVPPPLGWAPATLGEEVDMLVKEWYHTRGEHVPAAYEGIREAVDRQRAEELKELDRQAALSRGETVTETDQETGEVKIVAPVGPGPKPEFGTPEFWAWARRKRAFDNAERAKQGLPPLPTAKEKAAAKEARRVAKETKAAAAAAKQP